jgi:hypothetical protein
LHSASSTRRVGSAPEPSLTAEANTSDHTGRGYRPRRRHTVLGQQPNSRARCHMAAVSPTAPLEAVAACGNTQRSAVCAVPDLTPTPRGPEAEVGNRADGLYECDLQRRTATTEVPACDPPASRASAPAWRAARRLNGAVSANLACQAPSREIRPLAGLATDGRSPPFAPLSWGFLYFFNHFPPLSVLTSPT